MAEPREKVHDLVIVGGGPAGATAALRASQTGAAVLVIEKEPFPRAQTFVAWLGPAGVGLCQELKLGLKQVGGVEFKGLRLHSWGARQSVPVDDADLRGWLVDRATFDHALLGAATSAGAAALHGSAVVDVHLGEEQATLHLSDGRTVAGRVVLIADGALSPTARLANLTCAGQQRDLPQCLFAQYDTSESRARLDVAIGASRAGRVATVARLGTTVTVFALAQAGHAALQADFNAFCLEGMKSGLLPAGGPGTPTPVLHPSGIALDMDTHAGKRCLLIGDAGGFIAAFSGEGIYPAMRSGLIAAETALRALEAPVLQDELATFGAAWRGELADYLRMPNTDLGLLMPLVFNNAQMSKRVAHAFLLGQTL